MSYNFPSSPTIGQTYQGYTWDGEKWDVSGGSGRFTASSTAPVAPNAGDHWYDLSTGILAVYVNDGTSLQWVAVSSGGSDLVMSLQCGRLAYVSATALAFLPYNGNKIKINGAIYTIPTAGIAGVANTGVFVNGTGSSNLAASTVYWVFAFVNSGAVTADFRTAATHTASTTAGNEGVEIRTGDDTRTLIGLVRTNASSQFQNDVANRFVISWFNRQNINLNGTSTANVSTSSTVAVELVVGARVNFCNWAQESVALSVSGSQFKTDTSVIGASLFVDGVQMMVAIPYTQLANGGQSTCSVTNAALSEGFHYATPAGQVGAGTGNFTVMANAMIRG